MRVLIACERSGVVRRAFRAMGHEAWSCDIEPADDDQEFHICGDAENAAYGLSWDLMVGHPPCDHLAVSGARWFPEKRADGRQKGGINFFISLANAPIQKIALENPISIMSSQWRKPDQVIQPHHFGHPEFKATCLWLKNLPTLKPTDTLTPPL